MSLKRKWTPEEAEEWTKEDLIAALLASLSYITLTIGLAFSCLLLWQGYALILLSVVIIALLIYVIDPKLKTISLEYELKQREYLRELEKKVRWEE